MPNEKVPSINGAAYPIKNNKSNQVRPDDSFKKIMAIGDSDESQKKKKKKYSFEGEENTTKKSTREDRASTRKIKKTLTQKTKIRATKEQDSSKKITSFAKDANIEIVNDKDLSLSSKSKDSETHPVDTNLKKEDTILPAPKSMAPETHPIAEPPKDTTIKKPQTESTKIDPEVPKPAPDSSSEEREQKEERVVTQNVEKPMKMNILKAIKTTSKRPTSPDNIFNLIRHIIGIIRVTKSAGISTTSVDLKMPNSKFDGCKIILKEYTTAQDRYNVEIQGDIEAIETIAKHLPAMKEDLASMNLPFKINLETPKLLEEVRYRVNRKENSDHANE